MESIQQKLSRVRKPRVHITYNVETEGASIEKSLPFVVGVLGDFSGNSGLPAGALKDRKFVQIDQDNFDEVMQRIGPKVSLKVKNTLQKDDSEIPLDLEFHSMNDFEPINIVNQVPALKALLEVRNKIRDLSTRIDRSDALGEIIENVLQNADDIKKLGQDLGLSMDSTEAKKE